MSFINLKFNEHQLSRCSENLKIKFLSTCCNFFAMLGEVPVKHFVHDGRPADPNLLQILRVALYGLFNEGFIPPLLALVAETRHKREI